MSLTWRSNIFFSHNVVEQSSHHTKKKVHQSFKVLRQSQTHHSIHAFHFGVEEILEWKDKLLDNSSCSWSGWVFASDVKVAGSILACQGVLKKESETKKSSSSFSGQRCLNGYCSLGHKFSAGSVRDWTHTCDAKHFEWSKMTCDSIETSNTENMQARRSCSWKFTLLYSANLKHKTSNCIYEGICKCFAGYLPLIKKETIAKRGVGTRVIVLLGAIGASKMCTFFCFFSEITHTGVKTKECVSNLKCWWCFCSVIRSPCECPWGPCECVWGPCEYAGGPGDWL